VILKRRNNQCFFFFLRLTLFAESLSTGGFSAATLHLEPIEKTIIMKRRQLSVPAMMLGFALSFSACSNNDKSPVDPANTNTLQGLFQQIQETPQSFTVNAGTTQTITGARGTVITFNPQSFKNSAGIIASGTVNIQLTEAYTPGQMIMNGVVTTTMNHKLLSSGGCVNIVATVNQLVVQANNYSISFKQPAMSNNPMSLFTGTTTSELTGANRIWNDDSTATVPRANKDSLNQNFFYTFDTCVNFNWINCDYFYSALDPKTDIKIVMPDSSYNASNTQVFVIFPDLNFVSTLYTYDATTHAFSFGYAGYYLPVGTNIKVFIVGGKNNAFFMDYQQNISVTNNMTITSSPVTHTKTDIQTLLSGL
jgi:hypothetical protein